MQMWGDDSKSLRGGGGGEQMKNDSFLWLITLVGMFTLWDPIKGSEKPKYAQLSQKSWIFFFFFFHTTSALGDSCQYQERKRRMRCGEGRRTDGWRLLHHRCYGTAVNKEKKWREEEEDEDKESVTERQKRKWWKTKRCKKTKLRKSAEHSDVTGRRGRQRQQTHSFCSANRQ